jgi:hypothetical protein
MADPNHTYLFIYLSHDADVAFWSYNNSEEWKLYFAQVGVCVYAFTYVMDTKINGN